MYIAHRLRMPLLFVIAGVGLWFALKNRAGLDVLKERKRSFERPTLGKLDGDLERP
jgi:glucans biosynthesis protein C